MTTKPAALIAAILLSIAPSALAAEAAPAQSAALLEAPGRTAADHEADARRKPLETLALGEIRPGDRVIEFLSGTGYFTRLLAAAVGPEGQVLVIEAPAAANYAGYLDGVRRFMADIPNARLVVAPLTTLDPGGQWDRIVIVQGYHDLHTTFVGDEAVPEINRAFFRMLRPGGVLLIVDHSAKAGAGLGVAEVLHRIDEADVVRELEAAGFVLEANDDALRNPADDREASAFKPTIRGRTDQFMLRFRKPEGAA